MNTRSPNLLRTPSLAILLLATAAAPAQKDDAQTKTRRGDKGPPREYATQPDFKDVKYGPHERNVLDFWKATSDDPAPVVVYIHGGGFRSGDKKTLSPGLLRSCLASGISVAAIHYRLSDTAPFPAPMHDSVRAIQFIRTKASEWHLDPKRIACTGGSAGAGISLWIGFHDDMAKRSSTDPVERQSSRITCMFVQGAQCTYDPRAIKAIVGGRAHEHSALPPFFGIEPDEADSPKAHKIYEESAAITYLTKDDPPVLAVYGDDRPDDKSPGKGIHNVNFGVHLKEKMDKLGIECIVIGPGVGEDQRHLAGGIEFFKKHFGIKANTR